MMNINIYYGGRGQIEDPTLYVLTRIEKVHGRIESKFLIDIIYLN